MKNRTVSFVVAALSLSIVHSAHAQQPTPKGCFRFEDASQQKIIGYKQSHRLKPCPTHVVIPEGVREIGDHAFSNLKNYFPDAPASSLEELKKILAGRSSYKKRGNDGVVLQSVVLSAELERIGDGAFEGNELESVELPSSLQELGEQAFDADVEIRRE